MHTVVFYKYKISMWAFYVINKYIKLQIIQYTSYVNIELINRNFGSWPVSKTGSQL